MNTFKKIKLADQLKKALEVGHETLEAAWEVVKDPKATNIAYNATKLAKKGIEFYTSSLSSPSNVEEKWTWVSGIPSELADFSMDVVTSKNGYYAPSNDLTISEVNGIPIAKNMDSLYTPNADDIPKLIEGVGRIILEKVGGRYKFKFKNSIWGTKAELEPLECKKILDSPKAAEVYGHLNKFFEKKINRSVLFYGPPGTGKSCLVENLADKIGGSCMVLFCEDFTGRVSHMSSLVKMLRPDIIILNDINYMGAVGADILTFFEVAKATSKALLVTSNSIKMTPALLRPGRFDEMVRIDKLGEEVVSSLVGGLPEEVLEEVSNWPAAFLKEISVRVSALGEAELTNIIDSLRPRVEVNAEELGDSSLFKIDPDKVKRRKRYR